MAYIDGDWGPASSFAHRYITKENLIELLKQVPEKATVHITPVGEIGISNESNTEMLGYIAIGEESWTPFDVKD